MFLIHNYPCLTNLVLKTNNKHKIFSIKLDLEWQRGFAIIAKAFRFKLKAINLLFKKDLNCINVWDMLLKAKLLNKFKYNL